MLQETNTESPTSEFYVFCPRSGAVEIKQVLIGESIGVASEKPGKTLAVLKNVKNPPPEGMYAGTLAELQAYIVTKQPSEESIFGKIGTKIKTFLATYLGTL